MRLQSVFEKKLPFEYYLFHQFFFSTDKSDVNTCTSPKSIDSDISYISTIILSTHKKKIS